MKATNKTALASSYEISYSSLIKWLKAIPEEELKLTEGQRIITPKQLKIIYEYYGDPNE